MAQFGADIYSPNIGVFQRLLQQREREEVKIISTSFSHQATWLTLKKRIHDNRGERKWELNRQSCITAAFAWSPIERTLAQCEMRYLLLSIVSVLFFCALKYRRRSVYSFLKAGRKKKNLFSLCPEMDWIFVSFF